MLVHFSPLFSLLALRENHLTVALPALLQFFKVFLFEEGFFFIIIFFPSFGILLLFVLILYLLLFFFYLLLFTIFFIPFLTPLNVSLIFFSTKAIVFTFIFTFSFSCFALPNFKDRPEGTPQHVVREDRNPFPSQLRNILSGEYQPSSLPHNCCRDRSN